MKSVVGMTFSAFAGMVVLTISPLSTDSLDRLIHHSAEKLQLLLCKRSVEKSLFSQWFLRKQPSRSGWQASGTGLR
jgi:hypothetical protein